MNIFTQLNTEALFILRRIINEIRGFNDETTHSSLVNVLVRTRSFADIFFLDSKYIERILMSANELRSKDLVLFNYFKKTDQYEKVFNAAVNVAIKDQSTIANNKYVVSFEIIILLETKICIKVRNLQN